jgi:hypothetical protein
MLRDIELTWDGSILPPVSASLILDKYKDGSRTFLILDTNEGPLIVRATVQKRVYCLMDEMKEYFGLPKSGSHSIKIGSRKYTIYRHSYEDVQGVPLEIIRKTILFKVITGAYSTYEKQFYFRGRELLVNDHEPKPYRLTLSQRMIKAWFAPHEKKKEKLTSILHDHCKDFFGSKSWREIRTDLLEIVHRIDPELSHIPQMLYKTWDAVLRY